MQVLLSTFGSFGDIHPYIALGLGLKERGHKVTLATSGIYQSKIESEGLHFHLVRPDLTDFGTEEEVIRRVMDLKTGSEYFIRDIATPFLRASFEDLDAATQDADLLVTHPGTFAGAIVAELRATRLKWASTILAPIGFFSAFDPPVFPPANPIAGLLPRLRGLGPGFHRGLFRLMRQKLDTWVTPIHSLRAELGLPRVADPIMSGGNSPTLVLALFSRYLGAPQVDWPAHTVQTGFPFYDRLEAGRGMPAELVDFLASGTPPIVFTLGTAAVMDAGNFYTESLRAARNLGRRAVLLIGRDVRNRPDPAMLAPGDAIAVEYAPYSEVFPHSAAIVHQGGVGTTGQAMRSGRPMLVMPYSHDQPDNAARMARSGVGRTKARSRYTAATATRELRILLEDPSYAQKAAEVARGMQQETGIRTACDALEALWEPVLRAGDK